MKATNLTYLIIAAAAAIMAVGCSTFNLDDIGDEGINTSLAIPVGSFHATVLDVLQSADSTGQISIDENDHTLNLVFTERSEHETFDFADFSYGDTAQGHFSLEQTPEIAALLPSVVTEVTLPAQTFVYTTVESNKFNWQKNNNGKETIVDTMTVRQAEIAVNIHNNGVTFGSGDNIEIEYTLPEIISTANKSFTFTITGDELSSTQRVPRFTAAFPVTDHDNTLEMDVKYTVHSHGNTVVAKGAELTFDVAFNQIDFEYAHGRFYSAEPVLSHTTAFHIPATIKKDFDFTKNGLKMHSAELRVNARSNVGADFRIRLNDIRAVTPEGGVQHIDFGNGSHTKTFDINRPARPGEFAETEIVFDRNHGAINRLLEVLPDEIVAEWDFLVGRPDGGLNDFITNPMEAYITMSGLVKLSFDPGGHFEYADTIDADLAGLDSTLSDAINIDRLDIYLDVKNSLPVRAPITVNFMDEYGNTLFTKTGIVLDAPAVDEQGFSIGATEQRITLEFTEVDIDNILLTKQISFEVRVEGRDAESMMTVRSTDAVDMHISAFAHLKANLGRMFNKK